VSPWVSGSLARAAPGGYVGQRVCVGAGLVGDRPDERRSTEKILHLWSSA